MKKLINDPRRVVREMLEGLADLTPGLALLDAHDVAIRADLPPPRERGVVVISGGGAGHEPAHAGYVGAGLLHAAVVGDVFTSPSVDAVLAAIRAVAGPAGAVLVVKNYTGDRLNFGLAAELARASGTPIEIVVVADDVALRDTVPPERRRGIAGTVLVHKVVGGHAAAGASIERVAAAGRTAAAALGSMGVALGACTIPAAGRPGFTLTEDEIELGLGIHGEPGIERVRQCAADALVDRMLGVILEDRGFAAGERVVLLVNNLGGTPPMEMAVVARRALATLRSRGLVIERAFAGTFLSALEMPGCSLSVMRVDDEMLSHLDRPTSAPAWPAASRLPLTRRIVAAPGETAVERPRSADGLGPVVRRVALACAAALEAAEPRLTDLDGVAGDGDLGISMTRAAAAIRDFCAADAAPDSGSVLAGLADALRRAIGGSSGPFYAVGLLRAARRLAAGADLPSGWPSAFAEGVRAVADLGGARPGDRTMLDALHPAADALAAAIGQGATAARAWASAADAAQEGSAATANMAPRLGRASYLGDRARGHEDAGAAAVAVWLRAAADALA